jgi:hypothetical protein
MAELYSNERHQSRKLLKSANLPFSADTSGSQQSCVQKNEPPPYPLVTFHLLTLVLYYISIRFHWYSYDVALAQF